MSLVDLNGGAQQGGLFINPKDHVNVKDSPYNAKGDNATDDTTAINTAKAKADSMGIPLFLPDGTYVYNGNPSSYVAYYGSGVVVAGAGGQPHAYFGRDMGSSYMLSSMTSYTGILNHAYSSDNGTRMYILPKDHVTSGVGGVLKIFGDAYHLGQDYRDFGIFFSANQNNDTGYSGQGVNWLNSKVNPGGMYDGKNPDIGFCFQDGAVTGGRFVYLKNGFGTYATFIAGAGTPVYGNLDGAIRAEVHGNLGFRNNDSLVWLNTAGTTETTIQKTTTNDLIVKNADSGALITLQTNGGNVTYTDGTGTKVLMSPNYTKFYHGIVRVAELDVTTTGTSFTVSYYNRMTLSQPSAQTITTLTGQDGQQLIILFKNSNTTIQASSSIKLLNGVNYTGAADEILVLENFAGTWYETSRSKDHV